MRPSTAPFLLLCLFGIAGDPGNPAGPWRAVLDLDGGPLRFSLEVKGAGGRWQGTLCNGSRCQRLTAVRFRGDSVSFEMADYAATITATLHGDSLTGDYRNVGNRGPRVIPFRAGRGRWPVEPGPSALIGRWNATYYQDWQTSPRVFEFRNGPAGLEGTIISNTGDYGLFWGLAEADSFSLAHFDGSFVYLLTGRLDGDTLRGVFHAGKHTETPWMAVRSAGPSQLKEPTDITQADTTTRFRFSFPDLTGRVVSDTDPMFRGKVVLLEILGSWCPTCHDSAPVLVQLYRSYHNRGLEIVGLAYEVSGDTAIDGRQVRLYREKFGIPFPLLLAGVNDVDAAAATQPQLSGFTSFPTTIFLGRDGRARQVRAGFYGPATGSQHDSLVHDLRAEVEQLLDEKRDR